MPVDQEPREHDRLVSRLVQADLWTVAREACARAGAEGREQQVAYCLIVLAGKADVPRRAPDGTLRRPYGLDPDRDDFSGRFACWADRIAANLRAWGDDYEAIHDEAERFEIETLRRLIRMRRGDDVIDVLADALAAVLARGPRLGEMSIGHARALPPSPAQYAFQTPLPQWLRTAARRRLEPEPGPLDERAEQLGAPGVADQLAAEAAVAGEGERALIEAIASLGETRGLLAEAIERADAFDAELAGRTPASREAAASFTRVRAELVHVADELSRERRALTPMLAYVALAMRSAPQLMHVSVLSLRMEDIDRGAVEAMAATMRAIVADERQPPPALIGKTHAATALGVSSARVKALEEVHGAGARRAAVLAPVEQMLDRLPPVVADVAAIAAVTSSRAAIVRQNRHAAAAELEKVDAWFARVFRRYTIRRR